MKRESDVEEVIKAGSERDRGERKRDDGRERD